ncbi:MAG: hypothetical protein KAU31_02045 [Spirochaetaceae bacterium]|nr:hypothetical protein [Spirochaetaceae bacterium]
MGYFDLVETTEHQPDIALPCRQIVAHPEVRTLVNGEYLILAVDVVYDIEELDNPFGVHLTRSARAHTVRRHYGSHLCSNLVFSCSGIQRHVARRVNRDLVRLARRGIAVVGEQGGPFTPESVTSLIRW